MEMSGELEGLDQETQYILEVAAITHDIACPRENIENFMKRIMKTESGIRLTRALFCV